jgi:metal-dependent HD superfamily phosphatase/phosphodiesterase
MVTFDDVKSNAEIRNCIEYGNDLLGELGFTEHSFVHAGRVSETAAYIMTEIGYSDREIELARIAGYIHDIGNMINRYDHAQSGGVLAYDILRRMGMNFTEAALIAGAVGNHDEGTGNAISAVSASLILADKADVRRSRVRRQNVTEYDIHDRVNYAVERSDILVDKDNSRIILDMDIDTEISSVMDYFEIFLGRMLMCRKAAAFFGMKFRIVANGTKIL